MKNIEKIIKGVKEYLAMPLLAVALTFFASKASAESNFPPIPAEYRGIVTGLSYVDSVRAYSPDGFLFGAVPIISPDTLRIQVPTDDASTSEREGAYAGETTHFIVVKDGQEYRASPEVIHKPGNISLLNLIVNPVAVDDEDFVLPKDFTLDQNYPNPFNSSTRINYDLARPADVLVGVYDILGRKVTTLVSGRQKPGNYCLDFNAEGLPSGHYFLRMSANEKSFVKKMCLVK